MSDDRTRAAELAEFISTKSSEHEDDGYAIFTDKEKWDLVARALRAYAAPQNEAGDRLPGGLIVVPERPTEEMIRAWVGAGGGETVSPPLRLGAMRDWAAMVGAADRRSGANVEAAGDEARAEPFQDRVKPWMMACFGPEISADRTERNHRFLEEAIELVQSLGCTCSEAHQLVDYVFDRPIGDAGQEVGGVMVTLAALCLASSLNMHEAGEVELARIWTKVEAIRAKQEAKPKHSPLPMHVDTAPTPQDLRDRVEQAIDDSARVGWRHHYSDEMELRNAGECAGAALSAIHAAGYAIVPHETTKFKFGDIVTKSGGSSWSGHVVGFYRTKLTPVGYCVESEHHPGSVQIYPEAALKNKEAK